MAFLKERLCDDFNQEWTTAVNSSERFCLYASFKSNLLTENNLDFVGIKYFRDVLIKLRMGVLPLNANRLRCAHENASKILCSFCKTEIEDEVHFILFASVRYTRNFARNSSTGTCKLNILLRSRESSSQNLAFCCCISCL